MNPLKKYIGALIVCVAINYTASALTPLSYLDTPTASPLNQEKEVVVKNNSEKEIAVFAGPKEQIRDPQLRTYGGLSINKVYVKPNDVVCLMSAENKPTACTIIKPETTKVEVNTSATTIHSN